MADITLKKHLKKISKDMWKNMTPEQREARLKRLHAGRKKFWAEVRRQRAEKVA